MIARTLRPILTDIKLTHSVFALPFALVGLLLGTRGGAPGPALLLKVVAALVLARSAALAFNRLSDGRFDASNPRTAGRALPAGRVSRRSMMTFLIVCSAGFLLVAATLGAWCAALAPLVLAVLFLYSLSKRFTTYSHAFVGLALALAPPAAYLAARGSVESDVAAVLWLALAVLAWVAGFDIIYSCQDLDHDRQEGLHSIPVRWGVPRALVLSRACHVLMLAFLMLAVASAGLHALSWAAVAWVAVLLIWEHVLVADLQPTRLAFAFVPINGALSLGCGLLMAADLLWP